MSKELHPKPAKANNPERNCRVSNLIFETNARILVWPQDFVEFFLLAQTQISIEFALIRHLNSPNSDEKFQQIDRGSLENADR